MSHPEMPGRCVGWSRFVTVLGAVALAASSFDVVIASQAIVVKGRITAADTQLPIAGAKVRIKKLGTTVTDPDGRYTIRASSAPDSPLQVVISKRGYRRMRTWVEPGETTRPLRHDWNLLAKSSAAFDVSFFDHLVRAGSRSRGTSRWLAAPRIRILANRLTCGDFLDASQQNCPQFSVTSSALTSTLRQWFLDAIESIPALTGGLVPPVETVSFVAGSSIDLDKVLVPGAITLGECVRCAGWFPGPEAESEIDSYVFLLSERGTFDRGHLVRRIAGGLGYIRWGADERCADLFARDLRTVFCPTHGVVAATTMDAIMGRALYTRPIGNQYQDTDPMPGTGAGR